MISEQSSFNSSGDLRHRNTTVRQNRLLVTQTVRLKKEELYVRYAELGDPAKPTVLLLHGVPENLQCWYAVAPLLARDYHVLALDWPGSAQRTSSTAGRRRWAAVGSFRTCTTRRGA